MTHSLLSIKFPHSALEEYWSSEGKKRGFSATFVTLLSIGTEMQIKLLTESELPQSGSGYKIYAVHKAPLKDRVSQLGMMNVPIVLPPSLTAEHINAPKVGASSVFSTKPTEGEDAIKADVSDVEMTDDSLPTQTKKSCAATAAAPIATSNGKRMKMVKVTRTFMENGYQMTETVNEMVPCDDDDPEAIPLEDGNGNIKKNDTSVSASKPTTSAADNAKLKPSTTSGKQSNLMSFFKKAKQ